MKPAGAEKDKNFVEYDEEDFLKSDSEIEDDEGFVFDFNQNNKPNSSNQVESNAEIEKCNYEDDPNNNKIVYELNNNYYSDDPGYIYKDLKKAIYDKSFELVKNLIEDYNIDVNYELDSHWTPIMYSVSGGSLEITEYLIQKGADVNFSDDTFNVLMCACGSIDPTATEISLFKIVKLLLKEGADVNSCDKYYQTPLMYASRAGNASLIDFLVENGAEINAKDDNDWTSLSHACNKGNYKSAHKLLRLGADPLIYTIDYLYPYDLAKKSSTKLAELIKNYLRVMRIENINGDKTSNEFVDQYLDDDLDDGLSYVFKKQDDLETFLNALKLSNLMRLFKVNNITMQKLVNFEEEDLKKIGILDNYVRQLILNEIRKFHHKNWLSSSLIVPVKDDFKPNCNEAVSIISNISRHLDYITQNVKYIKREAIDGNKDLFEDEYLNLKFCTESKQALLNCNSLMDNLNNLYQDVKKQVKQNQDSFPVDLIKRPVAKKWYKDPLKITALSTIALSTMFIFKTKFFS